MQVILQVTATASMTETTIIPLVWHAIVASVSTILMFGTIATDGTTHGMIPGTAGMVLTIATVMQAGMTGAGAIITTMDGTMDGIILTTEATMEVTITGIMGVIRLLQPATWDSVPPHSTGELVEAGSITIAQQALVPALYQRLVEEQEVKEHAEQLILAAVQP